MWSLEVIIAGLIPGMKQVRNNTQTTFKYVNDT